MSEIKRIYFKPNEAAKELGISVEELRRRIKYLKIPIMRPHTRAKEFVIHYKQLPKIGAYRETLEAENKRLKLELRQMHKRLIYHERK